MVFSLALSVFSHALRKIHIDPTTRNGESPLPLFIEESTLSTLTKRTPAQMKERTLQGSCRVLYHSDALSLDASPFGLQSLDFFPMGRVEQ